MSHAEEIRYRQIARRYVSFGGSEDLRLEENKTTSFSPELSTVPGNTYLLSRHPRRTYAPISLEPLPWGGFFVP